MAKRKKMDTKILIIAVVLVLAAVLVLYGSDLPGSTTTTTTIASQTTTTIAPTTTTVIGDTCDDICLAADYSQGTCRPACLGYETRNDESGSDCTDIQKCCCK